MPQHVFNSCASPVLIISIRNKNMLLGLLLAAVGTFLFSLKSIFIKFLYTDNLGADEVLMLRMALSLPIYISVLLWIAYNKHSYASMSTTVIAKIFVLGFFGYYLASLLDLLSLELISAQLERLGLFTYPFMVAILGYFFFNEIITKRIIFSLLLTYAGLFIVMGHELKITGEGVILGTLFVLASALSFAFYVLLSKGYIKRYGSQLFTCIAMISSCIFGLLHGLILLDLSSLVISQQSWLWIFLLVIFSTVIPSFMMVEALDRIGPTQTGIMGMLGPVFTIILATYLLDEPFSLWLVAGVVLMMIGVANLLFSKSA
jgi:drug/metabolite transporter (DMT)-like permease